MRLYLGSAASADILRFGRRLKKGLGRFEKTRHLANVLDVTQAALAAAHAATEALEAPLDDASDDLKFAELEAEAQVRRLWNRTKELDGDRVGPITKVGFPDGITAVLAPKGRAQGAALQKLRAAYDDSNAPEVAAHKTELLAACDDARALLAPAIEAWEAADEAYDKAFATEVRRRGEHRRTVDAIFGGIREALPGETKLQNAIVPRVDKPGKPAKSDTDDDGGEPTPS